MVNLLYSKYQSDESSLPVIKKERGEKGKNASRGHRFAAAVSDKKAESYY